LDNISVKIYLIYILLLCSQKLQVQFLCIFANYIDANLESSLINPFTCMDQDRLTTKIGRSSQKPMIKSIKARLD